MPCDFRLLNQFNKKGARYNENNKKRNSSNTNQQGRPPQIPTSRDR
jgi:hypothetical protein